MLLTYLTHFRSPIPIPMPPKSTTAPELVAQTQLVRTVEATLKVRMPDDREKRFRASLLNKATADIAQFNHAHLVRLYEAACGVEFPEAEVTTFRHTCQDAIGRTLKLSDHRQPKPAQS
jgi:hypothetical protein